MAVSLRLVHTLCLEQLYGCLFPPLYPCTWTNLRVSYSGQTRGCSECTLFLTNESLIKITRLIRSNQSQASKLVTEDAQTGTDGRKTYRALGSCRSQKCDKYYSIHQSWSKFSEGTKTLHRKQRAASNLIYILKCVE